MSDLRARVEALYAAQTAELADHPEFRALEAGTASRDAYDAFLSNVVRAHLRSPKIVAFLYALSPPAATEDLLHNLLEELGISAGGAEDESSHPALLRLLCEGAGLAERLPALEKLAEGDLRTLVSEPLMYGTLRDVGLSALVEVIAFEWMLSRTASRLATALATHRGLGPDVLAWFTHHAEVDVGHAEQGLDAIRDYATYYAIEPEDAATIAELSMRENVFVRRYFGELALATAG